MDSEAGIAGLIRLNRALALGAATSAALLVGCAPARIEATERALIAFRSLWTVRARVGAAADRRPVAEERLSLLGVPWPSVVNTKPPTASTAEYV